MWNYKNSNTIDDIVNWYNHFEKNLPLLGIYTAYSYSIPFLPQERRVHMGIRIDAQKCS